MTNTAVSVSILDALAGVVFFSKRLIIVLYLTQKYHSASTTTVSINAKVLIEICVRSGLVSHGQAFARNVVHG